MRMSTVLRVVPLLAAAALLGACSASAGDLSSDAKDRSGVLRVRVDESDGDNDIPFAHVPKYVTVRMEGDASAEDVMAVFDAYDDGIDDEDVGGVDVLLDGPKEATLSAGEGIHVSREMVDDLVDAQHDVTVTEYRREAYPVLPGVRLRLAPTGFDQVVAAADRYRDAPAIEDVEIASGRFILIRDEVNEDQRITGAREELAHRVDARFGLRGAVVGGRGPLELIVDPSDQEAVRRLVEHDPAPEVGSVVVRTAR